MMPGKEVFTTGEVAAYCSVTTDAVLKWISAGKIRADHTPGGHHRIHRKSLIEFLDTRKKNRREPGGKKPFQFCWEFHAPSTGILESCRNCIVYRSRSGRCYELAKLSKDSGHSQLFCTNTCDDCEYFSLVHERRISFLIVTDCNKTQAVLTAQAKEFDCHMQFVENEYQCSLRIESLRPDYTVLDCSLGLDRILKLAKDIHEDVRVPYGRVILCGEEEHIPRDRNTSVFAFINAPLTLPALFGLVSNVGEDISSTNLENFT
ncbi:MAG: excisionase family DNA-binding protein [FCB group bacterium]|nr:excisionase family DNA-binding protein [FCB group bacterium]